MTFVCVCGTGRHSHASQMSGGWRFAVVLVALTAWTDAAPITSTPTAAPTLVPFTVVYTTTPRNIASDTGTSSFPIVSETNYIGSVSGVAWRQLLATNVSGRVCGYNISSVWFHSTLYPMPTGTAIAVYQLTRQFDPAAANWYNATNTTAWTLTGGDFNTTAPLAIFNLSTATLSYDLSTASMVR
jgi:hypothetical protein